MFIALILWIFLLISVLIHVITKGFVIKSSDIAGFVFGLFLFIPIGIYFLYTDTGRWVFLTEEGISKPYLFKPKSIPPVIKFTEIEGYRTHYDLLEHDMIESIELICKNRERVRYSINKTRNVCEILLSVLRKHNIPEISNMEQKP